jgi:cytochrome c oxidase subunit I
MFTSVGGIIMSIAALMFFVVFFATLFGKPVKQGALELITSEPYHDERVPAVQSFTPWLIGAALLLIIAYAPPIAQTIRSRFPGAPPYAPDRPVSLSAAPAP